MSTKVNTTKSIGSTGKTSAELAEENKKALAFFKDAKKVKVSIPTALAKEIGAVLYAAVNNVGVYVAVNGEDHDVPEPHALQIKEMLKHLN